MIKTRFAPSPTGMLHIGGARTALFNWMYARSQGGVFVLRIEDTDLQRSRKEYLDEILTSMRWLGLDWDEFYQQGERFELYRSYARTLVEGGLAYEDGSAVILRMPDEDITFFDIIRGEVRFEAGTMNDQVLMKSDGTPTYSFACVIDDALMEISHVIRGEDHISNTPKQIAMYRALGFKAPKFAHLPLIMDEEGGRMSKRSGATAVSEYRAQGFLASALVNYLMLLGWSPGNNQEIVDLSAAVKQFSVKKINKAAAAFSMDKLRWVNGQYIKKMSPAALVDVVAPFLISRGWITEDYDRKRLQKIVELYQSRMTDIEEFVARTAYIFQDEMVIDDDLRAQHLTAPTRRLCEGLAERLAGVECFVSQEIEAAIRAFAEEQGIGMSEIVHPVRVVLTGSVVGPGLFEMIEVLGKERTIGRLRAVA